MSRERVIGVLTDVFESPFQSPVLDGIEQEARRSGVTILGIAARAIDAATFRLAAEIVDGWIVITYPEHAELLRETGRPVVVVSGRNPAAHGVISDNWSGAEAAVQHLIDQGHTQIAFLGFMENSDIRERYDAYCAALGRAWLPIVPGLVVDTSGYEQRHGGDAIERLIDSGLAFSAVFAATDDAALGAMERMQRRGLRIPEDVAVVGFDDLPVAQYAKPPLSSVRQRPAELGRQALRLLLDEQLDAAQPTVAIVPTEFIPRASSIRMFGGGAREAPRDRYDTPEWRATLARDLVSAALAPIPLSPLVDPEQIWPGIHQLLDTIEEVLAGGRGDALDSVWREGIELLGGKSSITQLWEYVRAACVQRADLTSRAALDSMMRWQHDCMTAIELIQLDVALEKEAYYRLMFDGEFALLNQMNNPQLSPRSLDWLSSIDVAWGALALWSMAPNTSTATFERLEVVTLYRRDHGSHPMHEIIPVTQFPPRAWIEEIEQVAPGYLTKIIPLSTSTRHWGFLLLAERRSAATYDLSPNRRAYITTALEREALVGSLTERQAVLQNAYERERSMSDTIRELGCPVIPLLDGVLLVPLIGAIDEGRANQVIEQVLAGVSQARARDVLLDITAVPLVDTQVAAALIRTAQAAALLGARVALVGVRPEIAQSIVGLGVDLGRIATYPTLAVALQALLRARR
jgi:DNA-binding LacI/PurR family transcriptional regulator/anti-anti-sigma regulatory factor